jgi:hypothetical protein
MEGGIRPMSTQGEDFAVMYARELDRLAGEIRAYDSDAAIWSTRGVQRNSPGTLALHICGNLLHYVGGTLGGTGYVRDRDAEFSDRCSKEELLTEISDTRVAVASTLASLGDPVINAPYPGRLPETMPSCTTRRFLMHLLWHLGWHLGHIYYHRLGVEEDVYEL